MSDELKLLDCPFCGAKADQYQIVAPFRDGYRVRCGGGCGDLVQTGYAMTAELAAETWNRRTPSPRIKELEEALRAVLAEPAASCDGYADAQSDECPFCRARSALSQEGGE